MAASLRMFISVRAWPVSGLEFEERIKLNEAGNNKFNFLTHTDPYHAYYRHKIKEIQEGVCEYMYMHVLI